MFTITKIDCIISILLYNIIVNRDKIVSFHKKITSEVAIHE